MQPLLGNEDEVILGPFTALLLSHIMCACMCLTVR